jgi:PAS domain S-box-containing protein
VNPAAHPGSASGDARSQIESATGLVLTLFVISVGAMMAATAAVQLAWSGRVGAPLALARLLLGLFAFSGALVAWWQLRRARPRAAAAISLATALVGVALHSQGTGLGLYSPLLGGAALVIALSGTLLTRWAAVVLFALHLGMVLWLFAGHLDGGLRSAGAESLLTPQALLWAHGLIGGGGVLGAWTLRRLLTESLHRAMTQERRLTELLAVGHDWVWELDPQGRMVYLSESFEANSGRRREEFMRLGQPGGPGPADAAQWASMREVLRGRHPFRDQPWSVRFADGAVLHLSSNGQPLRNADGAPSGWWGVSRNVTQEVLAARAAQGTRDLQERLFASSPDAICVARTDNGVVLMANPAFLAFCGLPEGDVIGRSERQLHLWAREDDDLRLHDALRAAHGVLRDWPTQARSADGSVRDVLVNLAAFEWDGAPVAVHSVRDVTAQRRGEAELEQARAQADAASQAKSAFLATMSHEIRTPLNGVLGLARLLQDERDERRRRDYLQHLVGAAEGLAGLVSDVLDLSKIEAGRVVLERIGFDLHELVNSAFHTFAPLGRERGLAMHCRIDDNVPHQVHGDPVRVRQIISNYLNNALKFTQRGRIALVCSRAADGAVRIEVADSGIGIAAGAHERLFQPFSQADSSTTRRFGGTGLGLSISRELAVMMGGRVGAESELGRGSRFWVELPLAADARAQQDGALAEAGPALAGLTVLVAEDNPVNMLIVRTLLERLGATVLEAEDGAQAVERAGAARPDAVLMDLHMPVMDGLAAARALRADAATATVPLFALSAAVLEQERAEALAAGLSEFLPKPVAEVDLLRVLAPLAAAARR